MQYDVLYEAMISNLRLGPFLHCRLSSTFSLTRHRHLFTPHLRRLAAPLPFTRRRRPATEVRLRAEDRAAAGSSERRPELRGGRAGARPGPRSLFHKLRLRSSLYSTISSQISLTYKLSRPRSSTCCMCRSCRASRLSNSIHSTFEVWIVDVWGRETQHDGPAQKTTKL